MNVIGVIMVTGKGFVIDIVHFKVNRNFLGLTVGLAYPLLRLYLGVGL